MQTTLTVRTTGSGLYEFTKDVVHFVRASGVTQGLLTLFVQHTSCSLCVQENADPDVRRDLEEFFRRLVPASAIWTLLPRGKSKCLPAKICEQSRHVQCRPQATGAGLENLPSGL